MDKATEEANDALNNNEVPVGCVIVYNLHNIIIGKGRNQVSESKNATRHAELVAIDQARAWWVNQRGGGGGGSDGDGLNDSWLFFRECDIYVTVEPCIMCACVLR